MESWSSNTQVKQNRLFNVDCFKRQRNTRHDLLINTRRRYNTNKYICNEHRSTTICKVRPKRYTKGKSTVKQ